MTSRLFARSMRSLSIALAIATVLGVVGEAEAQRRRGRRGRRAPVETTAPAETEATEAEATPPPDPFAEPTEQPPTTPAAQPDAGAPTTAPPASATPTAPATTATTAPPVAPATLPEAGDPGPTPPDLAPIRQEFVALMDEMVQARSRVAIVGQELFHTRMTITVQDRTGDEQTLTRFLLELDGTPVHRTDGELEGGEQGRQVFEGALAPGPHVLTIDMEQRSREDPEYRATQRETFRFIVVRDRLSEVTIVLEDDSNIARDFRSGGEGSFDVRTRVRVATRELPRS